jgi:hypothetical protein
VVEDDVYRGDAPEVEVRGYRGDVADVHTYYRNLDRSLEPMWGTSVVQNDEGFAVFAREGDNLYQIAIVRSGENNARLLAKALLGRFDPHKTLEGLIPEMRQYAGTPPAGREPQ